MAEISYPFSTNTATGGTQAVSQGQWQQMSHLWNSDRVDFRLTASTYATGSLPFSSTVQNGNNVAISPGNAWVGGFYYSLTSPTNISIADNVTTNGRLDLIVIRADLTKGSVNLATIKGQPSSSPVAPSPIRSMGQQWDMPLLLVTVPAQQGVISLTQLYSFDYPATVAAPWNADILAGFVQSGQFILDMDSNNNYVQSEGFKGRDGYAVTRNLGKSKSYTPTFSNYTTGSVSAVNSSSKTGRWRWIAPNTVWFTANITTPGSHVIAPDNGRLGVTLPVPANGKAIQVLNGYIFNPSVRDDLPNQMLFTGLLENGTPKSTMALVRSNHANGDVDNMTLMPAASTLSISGVYEANAFNE
ncbi:hypothetical protein [Streptomyces sp. NPDC001422]|uniref:hypothetical protein n=1 Tax=Streptomyces sp. NPDC001422 TaxID=3364575 RepID=UPI0036857885